MRILYIHATPVPPPRDLNRDRFFLLSQSLEGEILHPIWCRSQADVEKILGPDSFPVYQAGRFRYHWFLAWRYSGPQRRLANLWFCIRKTRQLHRERAFDCIVVYSHITNGVLGVLLKWLTGAKLVIEIPTVPHLAYLAEGPRLTLGKRMRKLYADLCLHISLLCGDRAHLLYPTQLSHYRLLRNVPATVFHEFVPTSVVPAHTGGNEPYILLVGAPWYVKGADLLIAAFLRLAADYPDVKLKILGHFPDRGQLEALTHGSPQIEILKALPHAQTLEMIANAMMLVQPSRNEGFGRVVLEAMSAGIPVIGSDVGGIPHIIRDGETGYVVPGGDPAGLEARMRQLLADPELRKQFGARGSEIAHREYTEQVYVDQFTRMIRSAL